MKCKFCGAILEEGAIFCAECGTRVGNSADVRRCTNCGAPMEADAVFCAECGTRIPQTAPVQNTPVRPVYENPVMQTPQPAVPKTKALNTTSLILLGVIGVFAVVLIVLLLKMFVLDSPKTEPANEASNAAAEVTAQPSELDNATTTDQTNAASAVPAPPVFNKVEVSSTRGNDVSSKGEVVNYHSSYLVDGIMENCWTPNRHQDSAPWIILRADTLQHVTGIRFTDGYFKSMETYTKNRRIAKVEISYKGGSMIYDCTEHVFGQMQDVVLPIPVDTDYIKINILDTLSGEWHDICVSEIQVY